MTNPPFDEQPATVAQSSEFLTQWPSLAPAIQRLVEAKLREQIGALPLREVPEVSPAARDASECEYQNCLSAPVSKKKIGYFVQRAMDAAAAQEREQSEFDRAQEKVGLMQSIARLTKELAEANAQNDRNLDELSEQRKKIEGLRLDLQGARNELAECRGDPLSSDPTKIGRAGLIALLRSQRDKARKEFEDERDARTRFESLFNERVNEIAGSQAFVGYFKETQDELAAAQSALAEEKEARCVLQSQVENADSNLEQTKLSARHFWKQKLESCESALAEKEKELEVLRGAFLEQGKQFAAKLSTERAAREKVEAELRLCRDCSAQNHDTLCAVTATLLDGARRWTKQMLLNAICTIRAQLQQAEQERDEARMDYKGQRASEEAAVSQLNDALAQLSSLRAELAACLKSSDHFKSIIESQNVELAATQETVRRVEKELDRAKGLLEVYDRTDVLCTQGNLIAEHKKALAERDALQKQNVALEQALTEMTLAHGQAAVELDQARQVAAHIDALNAGKTQTLNARNAELAKALALTQRSYAGTFKQGFTVFLTGHEMRALIAALDEEAK